MSVLLCVDVGSTFTKGALVDTDPEAERPLLATASHPTTAGAAGADVLDGVAAVRERLEHSAGRHAVRTLACSSAGGGLRLAVVGYERLVTAEAGRRVALSAGGRVVHVSAGPVDRDGVEALRATRPDVVLLVGGTDGGDADVLLHNARRLAIARLPVPFVVAGNADAAGGARVELERRGRRAAVVANVLPRIGVLAPLPARAAIREAFLRHVIGGKGLSRGPAFARMVRAATPDAVLAGVEVLADGDPAAGLPGAGDVLVVDVGGATTDVYSVLTPQGEDQPGSGLATEVVAPLWRARTVEGDLGMRWGAPGVVAAAVSEGLLDADADADAGTGPDAGLAAYAARVRADPGHLPPPGRWEQDARLAELAVTVALRRHGRPAAPGGQPRPLLDVRVVVGGGGVLRHAPDGVRRRVLRAATGDSAGGWRVPRGATTVVDDRYVLFAAGLLAGAGDRAAAARVASGALHVIQP